MRCIIFCCPLRAHMYSWVDKAYRQRWPTTARQRVGWRTSSFAPRPHRARQHYRLYAHRNPLASRLLLWVGLSREFVRTAFAGVVGRDRWRVVLGFKRRRRARSGKRSGIWTILCTFCIGERGEWWGMFSNASHFT